MAESTIATAISVRGDAHIEVQPDLATLHCELRVTDDDKPAALAAASRHLDAVRSDLARLGGVVRTSSAQRAPLSWLARSARTHDEYDGKHDRPTGRVVASVELRVEVRDLDVLDDVADALAAHSSVATGHVTWSVDEDNAAWADVRARAIDVAMQRGRDYASALGGSLQSVDHIADGGLLAGAGEEQAVAVSFGGRRAAMHASAAGVAMSASADTPTLDPEPITIGAVIEARFTASVRPL